MIYPDTSPVIAWNGTVATARDVRGWEYTGFNIETTAAIATDTIFDVTVAPASVADNCLPGTFIPFLKVAPCDGPWVAATPTQIIIKAGTPKGATCAVPIPCHGMAFIKLASVSGQNADVTVIFNRHGKN